MPNRVCCLSNLGVLDSARVLVRSSSGDCHFDLHGSSRFSYKYFESLPSSLYPLGVLDSAPVLVSSSSGDCHFDFEWRTAAACVQGDAQGDTCRVFDEALGKLNRYIVDINTGNNDKHVIVLYHGIKAARMRCVQKGEESMENIYSSPRPHIFVCLTKCFVSLTTAHP